MRGDESFGKIWVIKVLNFIERLLVSKIILFNIISFYLNGYYYSEDLILVIFLMIEIMF